MGVQALHAQEPSKQEKIKKGLGEQQEEREREGERVGANGGDSEFLLFYLFILVFSFCCSFSVLLFSLVCVGGGFRFTYFRIAGLVFISSCWLFLHIECHRRPTCREAGGRESRGGGGQRAL